VTQAASKAISPSSIFVVLRDGSSPTAHLFVYHCDAYLATKDLAPGDYVFEVTAPSATGGLLSTDAITQRHFTVDATGHIGAYGGSHASATTAGLGTTIDVIHPTETEVGGETKELNKPMGGLFHEGLEKGCGWAAKLAIELCQTTRW
jgi:hypothetical protein